MAGRALGRASVWARPASILMVPVLAAEPAVAAWLGQERVAFDGAPLHVTVMFPFLPARSLGAAEEEAIAELAQDTEPFGFVLARLGQFPGVQYLAPEPASSFVAITDRIQRRWPSCRPYDGVYGSVIPHMTVAVAEKLPANPAVLERELPIRARADEFWLLEQTVHGWRTRRRFPLGRTSAAAEVPVTSQ
jgi:2'-5' RNA ligase superfamily protein